MAKSPRNQVVAMVTKHIDEFSDKQVKEILTLLQGMLAEKKEEVAGMPAPTIVFKDEAKNLDLREAILKAQQTMLLGSTKPKNITVSGATLDLTYLTPGVTYYYPSSNRTGTTTNYPLGA